MADRRGGGDDVIIGDALACHLTSSVIHYSVEKMGN